MADLQLAPPPGRSHWSTFLVIDAGQLQVPSHVFSKLAKSSTDGSGLGGVKRASVGKPVRLSALDAKRLASPAQVVTPVGLLKPQ